MKQFMILVWLSCVAMAWAVEQTGSQSPLASQTSIFEFHFEFANDEERLRYQQLTRQLRCPKCQNNNVSDSDAPIARDIRQRVYQLLNQGFSDEQIVEHMIARYGDFVTYRPPFGWRTAIIWLLPMALVLLAAWSAWRVIKSRAKQQVKPLNQAEKAKLSAWLEAN